MKYVIMYIIQNGLKLYAIHILSECFCNLPKTLRSLSLCYDILFFKLSNIKKKLYGKLSNT